jgi:hypothetical protein
LRFLLPILGEHFKGSFGSATGWSTLSRVYGTSAEPDGEVLTRQSLVAGAVLYRYIVTVGIGDAGLYLAVGGPLPRSPILIPWEDFGNAEPAKLFWQKAVLVSVGAPQVGTLTLPMTLYDRIRSHLPPRTASIGTPSKPV